MQTNSIKISVIVPVYNVSPYIREALDSIINQTHQNLEIILVDDGSTDGSGEICDSYEKCDPRILVIHQKNQGLSAARNTGLDHATGDVISFFDPDDAFHPQMFEKMICVMLRENVDIVECNSLYYYTADRMDPSLLSTGKPRSNFTEGIYDREKAMHAAIKYKVRVFMMDKLYRSYLWKTLRFPVGLIHEDIYLLFEVLDQIKTMYVMEESLIMHRKRPGSITTSPDLKEIRDNYTAQIHFDQFVNDHTPAIFSESELKQVRQNTFQFFVLKYLQLPTKISNQKEIHEWLIRTIKELRETVNLRESSPEIQISYKMIHFCPRLSRCLYRSYRKAKHTLDKT